jgi:hypothetical protein
MPHPIPTTLDAWLAAGWKVSQRGNPWLQLGPDMYVIFPGQGRPPGWIARAGRTVLDGHRWPDPESAKGGFYHLVSRLTPAELADLHGPPEDRQPARQADREPRERTGTPPQDDGELLAELPRCDGREALRVTLKTYEGHPFVALRVWARDDHTGSWWPVRGKGCTVRLKEAARVIAALQRAAALATARQAAAGAPAGSDRPSARAGGGGWTERLGNGARTDRRPFDDGAGDDGN